MPNHNKPHWIGIDWGTSNLRVFAFDEQNHVIAKKRSDKGMAGIDAYQFEETLLAIIDGWLTTDIRTPIFACGMVGAKQGWQEAAYRSIPCTPISDVALTHVRTTDPRINVMILPGLANSNTQSPDVMRGEETQLAGLVHATPLFDGAVCLPGTHSKWVTMQQGVVADFQTFMTGELFSLLCEHSLLRHSVTIAEQSATDRYTIRNPESVDSTFLETAVQAAQHPETVPGKLFHIRADSLLHAMQPDIAKANLSGLLIGQEIGCNKHRWSDPHVTIIGAGTIATLYASTLTKLGVEVVTMNADDATIAGLSYVATQHLREGS